MDGMEMAKAAAFIGAALAMGLGCLSPAYGQGLIGSTACKYIGKYPESADKIRMTMLLAMGIVESSAVYALVIAMMLILLNS